MKLIFEKLNCYFYGKWHLAVLDMDVGLWVIESKVLNIPYLKAENAKGRHILLQPEPVIESYYLLVDDLTWPMILSHHHYPNGGWKPGRMVVKTSPANYQVWIHSSRRLSLSEKRYWLKKLCSDPGADPNNRWGRCPGFRNRKEKYRDSTGGYPLSKLIWIDWKGQAEIPHSNNQISSSFGKREQGKKGFKDFMNPDETSGKTSIPFSPLPQAGGVCRGKGISRSDYTSGDESATDFSYAIALARRGYTNNEIRERIISERSIWKNHLGEHRMKHYLDRTIKRARSIVEKT
jgi:hypothetical protein